VPAACVRAGGAERRQAQSKRHDRDTVFLHARAQQNPDDSSGLIGEITAAGKTPNELTQELVKKYTRYFKQLDVAVFVESYGSRGVYVGGGVNTPGEIPILRNLTVLEAIMQAGGVNATTASLKNVVVVRLKEGKYERYVLDLEGVLLGTDNKPFYLMPLDVVYVPPRIGIP
jgi:polysaccharide export outer membrane protein